MNGDYPRKGRSGRRRCRCGPVCRRYREIKGVLDRRNAQEMKSLIHSLAIELACAELDNDVHQAILDGSWPSAVEQLTRGLEKAKAYAKRTSND